MLPTLVFILGAYGIYALISTLARRRGGSLRQGRSWRRLGLVLAAAAVLGGAVVLAGAFDGQHQNLQLAGFLGTVWAEGWPGEVSPRVEAPPIKGTASGEQPVYALLHPGTSSAEMAKKKLAPRPRPHFKRKSRKAPSLAAKRTQTAAHGIFTAKNKDRSKTANAKKTRPFSLAAEDPGNG